MSEGTRIKFTIGDSIVFEAQGEENTVHDTFDAFMKRLDAINRIEQLFTEDEEEKPGRATPYKGYQYITAPWSDVLQQLDDKELTLSVGDIVRCDLLDGTPAEWVVTDVDDFAYRFESRDCLGKCSHERNGMTKFLALVWDNMPKVLQEHIIPTVRQHRLNGNEIRTCETFLFLPAASEIFPPEKCLGDKDLYEQLDYYKDVHNRVRSDIMGGAETEWYWTDSPYSGDSTYWCLVNNSGCDNHNASYSGIAAPVCFRIRKSV